MRARLTKKVEKSLKILVMILLACVLTVPVFGIGIIPLPPRCFYLYIRPFFDVSNKESCPNNPLLLNTYGCYSFIADGGYMAGYTLASSLLSNFLSPKPQNPMTIGSELIRQEKLIQKVESDLYNELKQWAKDQIGDLKCGHYAEPGGPFLRPYTISPESNQLFFALNDFKLDAKGKVSIDKVCNECEKYANENFDMIFKVTDTYDWHADKPPAGGVYDGWALWLQTCGLGHSFNVQAGWNYKKENKIQIEGPKECTTDDPCKEASCDPKVGCVEKSIAGCDKPDETYDLSSLGMGLTNETDKNATIAVFNYGTSHSLKKVLDELNENYEVIEIDTPSISQYSVLLIPSGGLYGIDSLQSFKTRLENYVTNGGKIVVFSQQHGYEYDALPGGPLSGYGWKEDQSCQYGSVGISMYHPILSGQTSTSLNINVDGYFTKWPENASILLTRTKNSMPAALLYSYGKGTIIATTLYSDAAYGQNQFTINENKLIRDILSWAESSSEVTTYGTGNISIPINVTNIKEPGQLPLDCINYTRGETIDIPLNITNTNETPVNYILFQLFDPDFGLYNQNITESIVYNETKKIHFIYDTSNESIPGVYTLFYSTYNDNVSLGFAMAAKVCLDANETDSIYNVNMALKNPDGNVTSYQNVTVRVPLQDSKQIFFEATNVSLSQRGIWEIEYETKDEEWGVVDLGIKKFAVSNYATNPNGWVYQGQKISFDITSPQERVPRGSDIPLTIHIWNRGDTDTNITYYVYTFIFETRIRTVTVPANSEFHSDEVFENVQGRIPSISVQFYNNTGGNIGSATRAIFLVNPSVNVGVTLDRDVYSIGDNLSIFLNLTNPGGSRYNTTVMVRVVNPENNKVYEDTFNVTVSGFESYAKTYNLSIGLQRGIYRVTAEVYSQGEKIGSNSAYFKVLRDYKFSVDFNNPYGTYKVREDMNITLKITNLGNLTWNSKINLSIPILNFQDSKEVSLNGGETKTISFNSYIPETTSAGSHDVVIFIGFDNTTSKRYFVIPNSQLVLSSNRASYSAGEYLAINLTNTGGVDTTYSCSVTLYDTKSEVIYQNENLQGSIFATQTETLSFKIPEQVISGHYYLIADCEDLQINQIARLSQDYEIDGLEASLISKTVKKIYFSLEDLSILTNITNSDIKIMNGRLHLKILRPYVPEKTHVLSGYIFDSGGNALANVPVELEDHSETLWIRNITEQDGYFKFTNLPQDMYKFYINEYEDEEENNCSIRNNVSSCHEINSSITCENSYARVCSEHGYQYCDLGEGECDYFPCFWGDVGEGKEACYFSCDQCAFGVNQSILENYTSIEFADENMIALTDDLEINATLLKIDAELELNSSAYKNGDIIRANVTVKNNENFNLTDWLAAFGVDFENETYYEEIYFNLTLTNLLAGQTKSYIFTYKIPENNTYDEFYLFGGIIGNLNWNVESSKGTIKALTYKGDEKRIINVTT